LSRSANFGKNGRMAARGNLVVGTVIAAIVLAVSLFLASRSVASPLSDSFNLACTFAGPLDHGRYAFRVTVPKFFGQPQVVWVGSNTLDLRIVRFDDTTIIADLDQQLNGWPDKADAMEFRLNRITGDAEIDYLQKPKATDQFPGWLVMGEFSARGSCSKSEGAF
jgi:hypothetical protein